MKKYTQEEFDSLPIDEYLTEEEKREIVIDEFREKIRSSFDQKDRDRVIKNSVAKWIKEYIERNLTDSDKAEIKENVMKSIRRKDLSFYIFSKPDVWDRTEYSAYKIITETVKENEKLIKEKVTEAIFRKFEMEHLT